MKTLTVSMILKLLIDDISDLNKEKFMINIQNVSAISKHNSKVDKSFNFSKANIQKRTKFQTSLTSIQKESKYNDVYNEEICQAQFSSIINDKSVIFEKEKSIKNDKRSSNISYDLNYVSLIIDLFYKGI